MPKGYLHRRADFKQLIQALSFEMKNIPEGMIEKDYWIMHCLYSLKKLGFQFELKGGTSLSKGYQVIHRFSEDIDIRIEPDEQMVGFKVYSGKNHDDPKHRQSRQKFFEWIAQKLKNNIDGIVEIVRDDEFDDKEKNRNGAIRLVYDPQFSIVEGVRPFILLEVGFDRTTPNKQCDISSWAYDKAAKTDGVQMNDNRAIAIPCYEPKYTFVEKLQAIVRKYRLYKDGKGSRSLPSNFIRHYYDVYQLLTLPEVSQFIGTDEYLKHKIERFKGDDIVVANSGAFKLSGEELKAFIKEYERTSSLYYQGRPEFKEILEKVGTVLEKL